VCSSDLDGIKLATPLFLCLVCVELSDVVFAFDSVPAVFGVTQNPFVVYTSNIFAIAGLRSLFGVLSKAIADLKYLEKAVGVVLAVIAAKLGFEVVDIELLSPLQSLVVVIGILGAGVALSLREAQEKEK
jgi:predicted tellurium resistance membrane protein TerC